MLLRIPVLQAVRRAKKPWKPGDAIPEKVREEIGLPAVKDLPKAPASLPPKPRVGAGELFLDIEQRKALVEYEVSRMRAAGVFDVLPSDVNVNRTSMDRNFTQGEYEAICWATRIHAIVTGGRYAPETAGDRATLAEYAHVLDRLPEAYIVILDWVSRVKYPGRFLSLEDMPSKAQMAKAMFYATDDKYLRGGIDGFFKAVCQLIAHARAERQTRLDRQRLARAEYVAPQLSAREDRL